MRFCLRYILWLLATFTVISHAKAQTSVIDSLQKKLLAEKDDSVRSLILSELASNYSGYDTLRSVQFFEEAFRINKKKNRAFNWGNYYRCYSNFLLERGLYDQSLRSADTAIIFFEEVKRTGNIPAKESANFQIAETIMAKGATYTAMGRSEDAINRYHESLQLFESVTGHEKISRIATLYNSIATVFFLLNQYQKGIEYDLRSLPFHAQSRNEEMLAYAYTYVASDYMRLDRFDSGKYYLDKAAPLVTRLNKNSVNIEYYGKVGEMYWHQKDWATTKKYYTLAYTNAKQINNPYSIVEYLWGIAACYHNEGDYITAEKYLQEARKLAELNKLENPQRDLYSMISQNYYKQRKYKLAYDYLLYYKMLIDSVASGTLKQKITELDEKYQSQKKQQQIIQLEKDKKIQALSIREKSILNFMLFGSVGILLLVGFMGYRNLRHRQLLAKQQDEIQQQRIRELEKDKQLVAVDAMLKGQEEERSRLARDLHDGLGGLLSGVKFSLTNMKDNLIITPDNMAVFERSLDMIDTSIKELRRVAHNMMPEMLIKFGLEEALKEYCSTVNSTQLLTVKYQSVGMETRLDKSVEIIVYRIIQELLNNILKHAAASEVFVQLIRENNRLNIVVEDNGRGFDTANIENSKGAGWANIRSRVEYLKGQLDIHSEQDKGTLVNIEFNL